MENLIGLCRICSTEEFAQAGGGNISVKDGSKLYIKASGASLSDVSISKGYAIVDNQKVVESLKNENEPDIMSFTFSSERPSLETYFHSFLRKYVVHLHPTSMNEFLCSNNANFIEYKKPGFLLSKYILEKYSGQSVIYLKNHGVIFHSDSYDDILKLIKDEHNKHMKYWSINIETFWNLQKEYSKDFIYKVPYLESLHYIPILKNPIKPITPDIVLFLNDSIIRKENEIYIRAPTKQKCLTTLEVLRCYCTSVTDEMTHLNETECSEILDWDVEKYRKLKP